MAQPCRPQSMAPGSVGRDVRRKTKGTGAQKEEARATVKAQPPMLPPGLARSILSPSSELTYIGPTSPRLCRTIHDIARLSVRQTNHRLVDRASTTTRL